ncbi:hypothetical protein EBE87_18345 [Pseudoroseomonas wenyumeiae]|uniref:Uncharacterized protein n=1 Tax=Teichococcus wenyumeiae TaxID=2478470 RepID=A0A3A9JPX0_9PROT|nr:hypothetical protein D6Z83_01545 [Pseudoroseomonas wenyumeiae]RMI19830.1 hypothetical protein EBE87_18345 [Pseudoroseomonas wenyumeiae]
MQRFKWQEQAQRFLAAYIMICGHFGPVRDLIAAVYVKASRAGARGDASRQWRKIAHAYACR